MSTLANLTRAPDRPSDGGCANASDTAAIDASRAAHLVVYLPDLSGGGAERLQIRLAPAFLAAGMRVTFLVHRRRGEVLDAIPAGVSIVSLDATRAAAALPRLVAFLRRTRPELLIANTEHLSLIAIWAAALAASPTRVVVVQHNALSQQAKRAGLQFRALPFLCRRTLRGAAAVVAVSAGVGAELEAIAGLAPGSVHIIHNGVVDPDFAARAAAPVAHPWFDGGAVVVIAVGRMVAQKDHATLVRAFARASERRDLRLILLGNGPLGGELDRLAASLGVADRVDMPGFVTNPLPYIAKASVLVLSSRFEGFANVLVEALACGTQVVSADCPYGPDEILAGGVFGRLTPVGDVNAMANAILSVLDQPIDPDLLRARAGAFSVKVCAAAYLSLFEQLAPTAGRVGCA